MMATQRLYRLTLQGLRDTVMMIIMTLIIAKYKYTLGFHGLRVWPIFALGFRDLRINRTGFWV